MPKFNLDNKSINLNRMFIVSIFLVLLAVSIFFIVKCTILQKQLDESQTRLESQRTNEKVLGFTKLFIGEVLKTETEVDFETRLILESAVRDLRDEAILTQWNKFVNSQTEDDAQIQVKDLLELLVNKINPVK